MALKWAYSFLSFERRRHSDPGIPSILYRMLQMRGVLNRLWVASTGGCEVERRASGDMSTEWATHV
jgi:hypothetical protein